MSVLGTLAGGLKVASGIAGLFGKKKKAPTPRDNMMSQAQGARDAAEKYGFNPLTMLQFGQTGGSLASDSSAPPLASIDAIVGGLHDIGQVQADRRNQEMAEERHARDMAGIQGDQIRAYAGFGPQAYNATAIGQPVAAPAKIDPSSRDFIGPMRPVNVQNPLSGRWTGIHPSIARRLDIKDGDRLMAEDFEAISGEVLGEAQMLGELGDAAFASNTAYYEPSFKLASPKFSSAPPVPTYEETFGATHDYLAPENRNYWMK